MAAETNPNQSEQDLTLNFNEKDLISLQPESTPPDQDKSGQDFQVKQSIAQVVKRRGLKADQVRSTVVSAIEVSSVVVLDEEKKECE